MRLTKPLLLLLLMPLLSLRTVAQTPSDMTDLFKHMPDSLIPYLTENNRLDLIDYTIAGMQAVVTDKFESSVTLDTLCATYLRLSVSESLAVEMKVLPRQSSADSISHIVCVAHTYGSNAKETVLRFYDTSWQPLSIPDPLESLDASSFLANPQSGAAAAPADAVPMPDLVMLSARLSPLSNTLLVTPSFSPVSTEETEKISSMFVNKSLHWNGVMFK